METEKEFKYLAVKNWRKHQPKLTKNIPCHFINDYTDKDSHPDYCLLTCSQRYVLDACQRLRGRFGCNLINDSRWVSRALAVLPQERHNLTATLELLVRRGFLIPCNEQYSPCDSATQLNSTNLFSTNGEGEHEPESEASTEGDIFRPEDVVV